MDGGDPVVVVGGGISGIASALILVDQDRNVVLVEREDDLGGLLRSVEGPEGFAFDLGTHFVLTTGVEPLDETLTGGLDPEDWVVIDESLHEGHVFCGKLNTETGCIDTRALPDDLWEKGSREILEGNDATSGFASLEDQVATVYGSTFTEHVYRPVVKKLSGHDLGDLAPDVHGDFQIQRLVVFDSEQALRLKQDPTLDDRIAYARIEDGSSSITKLYPREGGIGRWIKHLEAKLHERGVTVKKGSGVQGVEFEDGRVKKVRLEDGATLDVGRLVWTLPRAVLLHAAGVDLPGGPPARRDLHLVHLVIDEPLPIDRHYVNCYDPELTSFRVTLYPNITDGPPDDPPHHITVEILGPVSGDDAALSKEVQRELRDVGVLPSNSGVIYEQVDHRPNAMPIRTVQHEKVAAEVDRMAKERFPEVTFVGPSASGSHGMIPTLRRAYDELTADGDSAAAGGT